MLLLLFMLLLFLELSVLGAVQHGFQLESDVLFSTREVVHSHSVGQQTAIASDDDGRFLLIAGGHCNGHTALSKELDVLLDVVLAMNTVPLPDLQLVFHGSRAQDAEIMFDVQEHPLDRLSVTARSLSYFVPLLHRLFRLLQLLPPDLQFLLRDVLAAHQQQPVSLLAPPLRELRDAP